MPASFTEAVILCVGVATAGVVEEEEVAPEL